jgi:hypothetical protein
MNTRLNHVAFLPECDGISSSIALKIDARYQFAVTCGAQSATAFFEEDHAISLHAHLPASLAFFTEQARLGAAALGLQYIDYAKACSDAFVAGYLGRIQQELRIIRPSNTPPHRHATAMH